MFKDSVGLVCIFAFLVFNFSFCLHGSGVKIKLLLFQNVANRGH